MYNCKYFPPDILHFDKIQRTLQIAILGCNVFVHVHGFSQNKQTYIIAFIFSKNI